MTIEVENKYHVADLPAFQQRLAALPTTLGPMELQVDTYFAHPARDFAQTDEALRIRQSGDRNVITYKGPKLDQATKTRRETELPLAPGEIGAAQWRELLESLGFRPVREVRKRRQSIEISWQGRTVDAALDEVQQVGTFVELEIVVEEADVPAAQSCLLTLAERLELKNPERRSYLELLIRATSEC